MFALPQRILVRWPAPRIAEQNSQCTEPIVYLGGGGGGGGQGRWGLPEALMCVVYIVCV
ncbi:hypothetical protein CGRA01v4_02550 [Colletotrichum graminicola]|nr:hypothetical protein CGRA01v4_02550 [Colletotrichum graminicola]